MLKFDTYVCKKKKQTNVEVPRVQSWFLLCFIFQLPAHRITCTSAARLRHRQSAVRQEEDVRMASFKWTALTFVLGNFTPRVNISPPSQFKFIMLQRSNSHKKYRSINTHAGDTTQLKDAIVFQPLKINSLHFGSLRGGKFHSRKGKAIWQSVAFILLP